LQDRSISQSDLTVAAGLREDIAGGINLVSVDNAEELVLDEKGFAMWAQVR
jgi:hypothetical protein